MEHHVRSVDDPSICTTCLGLGSGQPDSPVYSKYGYIHPNLGALRQSGELSGCQSCTLLWDALRTNVTPIGEAELQEQMLVSWTPGKPLEVIFCPEPYDDAVSLELFARDADVLQTYRMLDPSLEIEKGSSAASNLAIASQWLEECLTKHEGDRAHLLCEPFRPVSLPTRLIEVGLDHKAKHQAAQGSDPGFEHASYAARRYLHHSLPWIQIHLVDALCIIQDDPEDWAAEAEHMDKVYSNATLTITADRGEGSSSGIFGSQSIGNAPQELKLNGRPIYVNNNTSMDHAGGHAIEEDLAIPGPEMLWSCSSFFACACRRDEPQSEIVNRTRLYQYSEKESVYRSSERRPQVLEEDLRRKWHATVSSFTQRSVRYEGDQLPALAGMAKLFQLRFEKTFGRRDLYIAVMWEGALHWELLWQTFDSTNCARIHESRMASARPRQWRAPSWSWASISGSVKFEYRGPEFFDAEIMHIDVHPLRKNSPYGQLREGASLTLRGPIIHGLSGRQKRWQADRGDGVIVNYVEGEVVDSEGGTYTVAWDNWESVQHREGDMYSCLKIGHRIHPAACEHYLVLRRRRDNATCYERVGVNLWAAPGPLFEKATIETVTIQ
ncbi:hypothetical protein CC79DRAFT_1368147 [Sarocladium strictum]